MSEEEIIKIIKYMLENKNTDINVIINYEAIQGLLDLYKKEKERNALLLANNNGYFELKKYMKNNYISKDKIREIIEDIEGDIDYLTHDLYEDLKKLLEE